MSFGYSGNYVPGGGYSLSQYAPIDPLQGQSIPGLDLVNPGPPADSTQAEATSSHIPSTSASTEPSRNVKNEVRQSDDRSSSEPERAGSISELSRKHKSSDSGYGKGQINAPTRYSADQPTHKQRSIDETERVRREVAKAPVYIPTPINKVLKKELSTIGINNKEGEEGEDDDNDLIALKRKKKTDSSGAVVSEQIDGECVGFNGNLVKKETRGEKKTILETNDGNHSNDNVNHVANCTLNERPPITIKKEIINEEDKWQKEKDMQEKVAQLMAKTIGYFQERNVIEYKNITTNIWEASSSKGLNEDVSMADGATDEVSQMENETVREVSKEKTPEVVQQKGRKSDEARKEKTPEDLSRSKTEHVQRRERKSDDAPRKEKTPESMPKNKQERAERKERTPDRARNEKTAVTVSKSRKEDFQHRGRRTEDVPRKKTVTVPPKNNISEEEVVVKKKILKKKKVIIESSDENSSSEELKIPKKKKEKVVAKSKKQVIASNHSDHQENYEKIVEDEPIRSPPQSVEKRKSVSLNALFEEEKKRKRREQQAKREATREKNRKARLDYEMTAHRQHWNKEQDFRKLTSQKIHKKTKEADNVASTSTSTSKEVRKRKITKDDEVGPTSSKKRVDSVDALLDSYDDQESSSSSSSVTPKRVAHVKAKQHSQAQLVVKQRNNKAVRLADSFKDTYETAISNGKKLAAEKEKELKQKKFRTQEELYGQGSSRIGSASKGETRQARVILPKKTVTIKKEPGASTARAPVKPKAPEVLEPTSRKFPLQLRRAFIEKMFNQFFEMKHPDAAKEAQKMEFEIMRESKLNTTYKASVCNRLNRLRSNRDDHCIPVSSHAVSHDVILAGPNHSKISVGVKRKDRVPIEQMNEKQLYEKMSELRCDFETMKKNAYPHFTAESGNTAVILKTQFDEQKVLWIDEWERKRVCCRCFKHFEVDPEAPAQREKDICRYHNRGHEYVGHKKNAVKKHICCREIFNTVPGCRFANVHVFDQLYKAELNSFVSSPKASGPNDPRNTKFYGIDCEMVYTTNGPALARVSMVGKDNEKVLDVLVKPPGEVLDPNTEFSGLTMEQVLSATDTIETARQKLFRFVNENTILIGHSLDSDLKAMRLVHLSVVDTALLFSRDKIFKSSLRNLAATHLQEFIQSNNDDLAGHDSFEDAKASMSLAIFRLKHPTTV